MSKQLICLSLAAACTSGLRFRIPIQGQNSDKVVIPIQATVQNNDNQKVTIPVAETNYQSNSRRSNFDESKNENTFQNININLQKKQQEQDTYQQISYPDSTWINLPPKNDIKAEKEIVLVDQTKPQVDTRNLIKFVDEDVKLKSCPVVKQAASSESQFLFQIPLPNGQFGATDGSVVGNVLNVGMPADRIAEYIKEKSNSSFLDQLGASSIRFNHGRIAAQHDVQLRDSQPDIYLHGSSSTPDELYFTEVGDNRHHSSSRKHKSSSLSRKQPKVEESSEEEPILNCGHCDSDCDEQVPDCCFKLEANDNVLALVYVDANVNWSCDFSDDECH